MSGGVLDGKVVLITGAGSPVGLGKAMALAVAAAGARVALMDVSEPDLAQSATDVREVAVAADAVMSVVGDVSEPADAARAVTSTIARFGALHVLINNAGITLRSGGLSDERWPTVWEVPPEGWARVISVNLNGAFNMAWAAVPPMLQQGWGRVIGVTTSFHTMIRGHVSPYGPSKAGHEALVSNLAYELEGFGVTANVLVPGGAADTNLAGPAEAVPAVERSKLIRPGVMGPPAVWLASDASGYCNGMRFIATEWDEALSIEERVAKAGAPVAWPQLGLSIPRGKPAT